MLEFIKKHKKFIGIIGAGILLLGGIVFGINTINYTIERDHLFIGAKQSDNDVVSMKVPSITNKNTIETLRTILKEATEISLISEDELSGKEVYFSLEFGTYTDRSSTTYGTVWFKDDGTAIYRDNTESKFYEINKDNAQKLSNILK